MSSTGRIANETKSLLKVTLLPAGAHASATSAPDIPARDAIAYHYNPGDWFLLIDQNGRYKYIDLNAHNGNVIVYDGDLQPSQGDCKLNSDCPLGSTCSSGVCVPLIPPSRQINLTTLLPMIPTILPQIQGLINSPLLSGYVSTLLNRPELKAIIPNKEALLAALSDPNKANSLLQSIKNSPQATEALNSLVNDPNIQSALNGFLSRSRQVVVVPTGPSLLSIILWIIVIAVIVGLIYYFARR